MRAPCGQAVLYLNYGDSHMNVHIRSNYIELIYPPTHTRTHARRPSEISIWSVDSVRVIFHSVTPTATLCIITTAWESTVI